MTQFKQNNTGERVAYKPVLNGDSLVGASAEFVMMQGSMTFVNTSAIVDEANSQLIYEFSAKDTLYPGNYIGEFRVVHADGTIKHYPEQGYLKVRIDRVLDPSETTRSEESIALRVSAVEEFKAEINAKVQTIEQAAVYAQEQGDYAKAQGDSIEGKISETVEAKVGTLDNLQTTDKTSIVNSVNEVNAQLAETAIDSFSANPFLEMPENYLAIPSALGSNLTTHPSIVDFGEGNSWNGYRYWLAHTPYPGTANENPSIAASNDNANWILPTGAPNPLIPAPTAPAYYSDTEMVYLPDVNKLRIYYRQAGTATGGAQLFYIESTDGVNWSAPVLSLDVQSNLLSPAIIRESATSWKMWYVESETNLGYRTSTDGVNWSAETPIAQPWVDWSVWHIGIVKDANGKYHLLGSAWEDVNSGEGTQYRPILYASSVDGISWTPNEKPQLIPSGWAGGYLYRPSFVVDISKGTLDSMPYVKVWFSASEDTIANGWHIGYAEGFLLNGDKNPSATSERVKRKRTGEYFKVFASNIVAPFAKIARLVTKRVQIKSDYSQPILEMYDGRKGNDGGNYMRMEYNGNANPNTIRYYMTFYDDNGNYKRVTLSPFLNGVTLGSTTDPFIFGYLKELSSSGNFKITAETNTGSRFDLVAYNKITGGLTFNSNYIKIKQKPAETTPPNMSLYEDTDGILKYKNSSGVIKNLTT